jgi:hypothetical protein
MSMAMEKRTKRKKRSNLPGRDFGQIQDIADEGTHPGA